MGQSVRPNLAGNQHAEAWGAFPVELGPERAKICPGCCMCEPGDWLLPMCDGSGLVPMEDDE